MAYNDGGIVSFVDKGVYSPTVTYHRLNYVKDGNSVFIAKQTTLGNAPNHSADTAYWMKLVDVSGAVQNIYDYAGTLAAPEDALEFKNAAIVDNTTSGRLEITVGILDSEFTTIQSLLA